MPVDVSLLRGHVKARARLYAGLAERLERFEAIRQQEFDLEQALIAVKLQRNAAETALLQAQQAIERDAPIGETLTAERACLQCAKLFVPVRTGVRWPVCCSPECYRLRGNRQRRGYMRALHKRRRDAAAETTETQQKLMATA
jgi:hypothetical protein